MTSTNTARAAVAAARPDRTAVGPLEDYLTQVALGHTAGLRQQLGEPRCAVLDARAAIVRAGGRPDGFVAALKDFLAAQAGEQHALLHEVDAGLCRALERRARRLAEQAERMGADLLQWWALRLVAECAGDRRHLRCVGLHLVWAHVVTGQVVAASNGGRQDRGDPRSGRSAHGYAAPGHGQAQGPTHTRVSHGR